MPDTGENFLNKYSKTKKSTPPQGNFFEIWYFSIFKSRRVHFLYESPTPLVKLGGLT